MAVSPFTQQLQAMLPQWMKMAKDPNSAGAQFLNVFGMEFDDIKKYLDAALSNQFIDTVNLEQIDITHKVPLALPVITNLEKLDSVIGYKNDEMYPFRIVTTIKNFYTSSEDENTAILDQGEGVLYIRANAYSLGESLEQPFDYILINGTAHYEYTVHHIWNALDEFGLLLGIDRLYGERNASFKKRILEVFQKPGNSTKSGIANALSRELGITTEEVKVNEFASKAFRQSLLNEDGSPSKKLVNYVERINKILGFTWDNMTWGEAYWRSVEESRIGLEYLPHVWDVGMDSWKDEDFQSGIGDGDELKVTAPKKESDVRNFKAYVGVKGMQRGTELLNPEIHFKYKITAKGKIYSEEYKPEVYKYTVTASEIILLNYRIRAIKLYPYTSIVDFNTGATTGIGYVYDTPQDPSIEIIDGTTNLSTPEHTYFKLKMYMAREATNKKITPSVESITVKWQDTLGASHSYVLSTQEDFTRNDGTGIGVDTNIVDAVATVDGKVELGYGDFYKMIDSKGAWEESTDRNGIEVMNKGSIKLILPQP